MGTARARSIVGALAAAVVLAGGVPASAAAAPAADGAVVSPVPLLGCTWDLDEGTVPAEWECGSPFRSKGTTTWGTCFNVKPPTTPYAERLVGNTWKRARVTIDVTKISGVWCDAAYPWMVDIGPIQVYAQERGRIMKWRLVIPAGGGYRTHVSTFGVCVTAAKTNYLHKCT